MQLGGQSRTVKTNQTGVHDKLEILVKRYQSTRSNRPVSAHTLQAFDAILPWLKNDDRPLILDSCCGVGQSTVKLAGLHPNVRVLGVDKSEHRLDKHHAYATSADNYRVVRADLNDFWRLLYDADIRFSKHYLLYPNPYPKATQIQKRWYASAVMPYLTGLSDYVEVRSNWRLYLEEFAIAASHYGLDGGIDVISGNQEPFTPFERKYQHSGQPCYQLIMERAHD